MIGLAFVLLVAIVSSTTLAIVGGSWWYPAIFFAAFIVVVHRHGRNLRLEEERKAKEVLDSEDKAKSLG